MAGYTIYIPGVHAANPKHLDKVGLGSLQEGSGPEFADILNKGPDGGHGVMCAWRTGDAERDPRLSIHLSQVWTPAKADEEHGLPKDRFWFGVELDRPVTPEDCARKTTRSGYPVRLCDGNAWTIPAAVRLPHKLGLDDSGRFERRVSERYSRFYEKANEYAVHVFQELDSVDVLKEARPDLEDTETVVSIELEDTWTFVCDALAVNYRLTPELIDMLALLDDSAIVATIMAVIDLPEINAVREQKKSYCPVGIPVG